MNNNDEQFKYVVDASADEPIMLLNKHVGFDTDDGMGIDGAEFQSELLRLDTMGKKRIQIWINSPGGVIVDGFAIYNAILKTKTKVDTYNVGIAASIAAVIFQAGRKRLMADYAILMYHNALGGDESQLGIFNAAITSMIQRSGMSREQIVKMMSAETFLNANEALKEGLVDEIEASVNFNRKAFSSQNTVKEIQAVCNTALKSKIKKNSRMKKVFNTLNLIEDANEESVLAAITAIENRATLAEAQNKADKAAIDKAKADLGHRDRQV
jgi:ATP-dependent Clp endopeptidase proteolytic subunit ClpP